jgi:drug/metabolite transporter (DMT)-like permease
VAALVLACVLWAGSAIAAKVAMGDGANVSPAKMGPLLLACVRFGVAGGLLAAYLGLRRELEPIRKGDGWRFVALGALGIALTYAVFYGGMRFTTATETTFLVAAEPILIALLARAFLAEALQPRQAAGLTVGLAGVYIIVFRGLVPHAEGSVWANAVVTAALVFEALSSVLGKDLVRRYAGLVIASYGMLIGSAFLAPAAVWETLHRPPWRPGAAELVSVAYLTLLCSCLCYGIWYSLLKKHTVSSMAAFLFIQPLLGPVYGALILGEHVSLWTLTGAAATVAGVWMVAASRDGNGHSRKGE